MSDFTYCQAQHQKDIAFACLSQNRRLLFCQKCFASHKCVSTKCGDLKSLNFQFSKNIEELKIKNKLDKIGANSQQIIPFYDKLIRHFTAHMKQINKHIPIILTSKLRNIKQKIKQDEPKDQFKDDLIDYEFKKLNYSKIEKSTQQYSEAIKQIVKTINEIENKKKQSPKNKIQINRTRQQILEKLKKQFPKFLGQLTESRIYLFEKLNEKLDDFIIGSSSEKERKHITFQQLQKFHSSQFDKLRSLRYGIDYNITKLEQQPQSLLAFCKNILRQQTYKNFKKQQTIGFVYSNFYPISTTVENNRNHQQLFFDIETKIAQQIFIQTNPSGKHFKQKLFEMSQKIIIMGPQLIVIFINTQGKNKQFLTHRLCDQNQKSKQRQQIYGLILSKIGLKQANNSLPIIPSVKQLKYLFKFEEQIDKIYCFFYISVCILNGDSSVLDIMNNGNNNDNSIKKYIEKGKALLKKQTTYFSKNQEVDLY